MENLLTVYQDELANYFDERSKARAAKFSHYVAREAGVDITVDIIAAHIGFEISDSVLKEFAKVLGKAEFVRNSLANSCLCWMLDNPEAFVRQRAVKSVIQMCSRNAWKPLIRPGLFSTSSFDMVDRGNRSEDSVLLIRHLMNGEQFKSFFQRISVCELFASPVDLGLTADECLAIVEELAKDPVPMVRAALAKNLGGLRQSHEQRGVSREAALLLMRDPDDMVQQVAIEHCLKQIALETMDDKTLFLHIFKEELVFSPSWRTRFAVAKQLDKIYEVINSYSPSHTSDSNDMDWDRSSSVDKDFQNQFSAILVELLSDPERNVRSAAASHFHYFINEENCAYLEQLVDDEDILVRKTIISKFHILVHLRQSQVAKLLNKVLVADLAGEIRTFGVKTFFKPDVFNAFSHSERLDIMRTIYNASSSSESRSLSVFSWRTIDEALKGLPIVVSSVSAQVWQDDANGFGFFIRCLRDDVYRIRHSASQQIGALGAAYGKQWISDNLGKVPRNMYEKDENKYKIRIQALIVAYEMSLLVDLTDTEFIKYAIGSDPVLNVKRKAALLFPSLTE